jgi:ElaB/YqjD/DUF883 family membrane-anchored ribosome-binding protein
MFHERLGNFFERTQIQSGTTRLAPSCAAIDKRIFTQETLMAEKSATLDKPMSDGNFGRSQLDSKSGAAKPTGISDQIELLRTDLAGLAVTVTGMAKEQFGETLEGAQTAAADKAGEMTAAIKTNPMQSIAIAAGVGFVVGLILSR